ETGQILILLQTPHPQPPLHSMERGKDNRRLAGGEVRYPQSRMRLKMPGYKGERVIMNAGAGYATSSSLHTLRQSGGRWMPDSAGQDTFNERELEVLRLIAEGWSNREIADELIISVNTVRWYNKQIYSKLGVHSRTLAIARARNMGLLAVDSSSPAAAMPEQEQTVEPTPALRHNLPAQLTPFIGRRRELNELADLLADPDVRLITIIGPGGIGKTRLAIETARSQIDAFEHGVYLVSLAPLDISGSVSYFGATMSDFIIQAVADAIGLSFYAGREPGRQLIEFLRDRQLLLVMDNFEHLLAGVDVLDEMLQAAPKLQVLATSRETLGIYGEAVYPLAGLPLTAGEAAAQEHDSLHLFVQSARRALPEF